MHGSLPPRPPLSRLLRPLLRGALLLLAVAGLGAPGPARAQDGAGIAVRAGAELRQLLEPSEILRSADYEGFGWYELSPAGLARLEAIGLPYERVPGGTELGINVYRFDPLDGLPELPAALVDPTPPASPDFWLVQLIGPSRQDWLDEMDALGLTRVQYHAEHAYLVWATEDQIEALTGAPFVRWMGRYEPAYRLAPELLGRLGPTPVTATVFEPALGALREAVQRLGGRITIEDPPIGLLRVLVLEIEASRLPALAAEPGLVALGHGPRQAMLLDEMSDKITAGMVNGTQPQPIPPRYTGGFLNAIGYDGDGVVVHVNDAGIREQHADLTTGRMVAEYGNRENHHGTHVAGIVLGLGAGNIGDTSGGGSWIYGLGVAPGAQYIDEYFGCAPSTCTRHAIENDANVSNNSWGYGSGGGVHYGYGYTGNARTWDLLAQDAHTTQSGAQPLTIVAAAGNGGSGSQTIGEPWEAKNVISVAAARNWRSSSGNQGSGNIDSIASWSSRGPCRDGRNCPVVTATGQYVISARFGTSGCGAQGAPNSTTHSVCSGTSMSSPHVAGAVALITEWWRDTHNNADPSPAMARALVVNGAKDIGAADIPNSNEGWGRVNVWDSIDPGLPTLRWDQPVVFGNTGESWSTTIQPYSLSEPMKVSLAWTDAAGPGNGGSSAAWVNNLDLRVQRQSTIWRGNVFASGWSITGGNHDIKNNLENVYIQSPNSGSHTITITAANIAGDGVVGNGDTTDQDWALVCQNCSLVGGPTATPPPTSTPTPSNTPTATYTPTPPFGLVTLTPELSPTPEGPPTASPTPTPNPPTATWTPSPVPTATWTPTAPPSPSSTPTSTWTPSPTASPAPSSTPTATPPPSATPTPSATPLPTATVTPLPTATASPLPSATPSATATPVPSATATATTTPSPSSTATPTPTPTHTPSPTPTDTPTPTPTPTNTATPSPTSTPTPQPTNTPTPTITPTFPVGPRSVPGDPARIDRGFEPLPGRAWLPAASQPVLAR